MLGVKNVWIFKNILLRNHNGSLVNKIIKRSMMNNGGNGRNLGKLLKKPLTDSPTVNKQNFAMIPYKLKKGIKTDNGSELEKLTKNHISGVDDNTNLSTISCTKAPEGPNGEKNELITPHLMIPGIPLHPKGSGQYGAVFDRPLLIETKHIIVVTNPYVVNYFKDNQESIQCLHDKSLQSLIDNNKQIQKTVDPKQAPTQPAAAVPLQNVLPPNTPTNNRTIVSTPLDND